MRTKVLVCAAALAASLASSMAQNVYSLNVVGYVNITMKGGGYTLCANQLNQGTNGIGQVLPNPLNDTQVLKFANNNYNIDVAADGSWFNAGNAEPSTTQLSPGEGFFYYNPGAQATVTLVGEVPQGTGLTVNINPSGYSLVGTYTPEELELSAANGFTLVNDMQYLPFANDVYTPAIAADGAWYDAGSAELTIVKPKIGQGYFIYNPESVSHNWVRNFTVQ